VLVIGVVLLIAAAAMKDTVEDWRNKQGSTFHHSLKSPLCSCVSITLLT
jgi:hypothetical protein